MSGQAALGDARCSLTWRGCYDAGWQGEIVPEAFAHPAKVSRALIRHIYEHAFAEGWLRAGDVVADPFGGIGGTALDAMWNGLTWVGCELEPKFVGLAQQNLDLWQRKYGSKAGFGSARILQGDSRKLSQIIAGADVCVSSPPFCSQQQGGGLAAAARGEKSAYPVTVGLERNGYSKDGYQCQGDTVGQLGAMREGDYAAVISSPPFVDQMPSHDNFIAPHDTGRRMDANFCTAYGATQGQLGAMKEGDAAAVISSPPYAAIATGAGGLNTKPGKDGQQSGRSPDSASQGADQHYGESVGQLSGMTDRGFDAVVSSPPYEGTELNPGNAGGAMSKRDADRGKIGGDSFTDHSADGYGDGDDNLGNQSGDTFWSAAKQIVAQCHLILRPGGHAIWICKDFVRKGKRVPFSDQWQALCEAQGFRLVCRHRAMLVAHHGAQDGLFGEAKQLVTERKSFFRRLHEKKPGAVKIDWEDVLCLRRA